MKKNLFKLSLFLAAVLVMGFTVCAAGEIEITANMAMKVSAKTDLHENADEASSVVATFEADTPVIIMENPQNGWCRVSYQETSGYVKVSALAMLSDSDEISDEFEQAHNQVQLMFDSIVLTEKEKGRSRIWGAIIVILVVLIFGVGILSTVKGNKGKKKTEGK